MKQAPASHERDHSDQWNIEDDQVRQFQRRLEECEEGGETRNTGDGD
jgi:hypothetical protein